MNICLVIALFAVVGVVGLGISAFHTLGSSVEISNVGDE